MKNLMNIEVRKHFSLGEEIANSVTHGIGMLLSIVALLLLIIKGGREKDSLYLISVIIYSMSMITLYFSSMLYHGFPKSKAKDIFEKFDHASVYLLIAGTYTPYCLVAVGGTKGIVICLIQWTLAITGVVFKTIWIDKFVKLHVVIYLIMGWLIVFFGKTIYTSMSPSGFMLLFTGGMFYSVGVLFYVFDWFKYHHLVWHLFVLFASISIFFSIYLYL
ncbi:MAG: hemolysin III family protein [Acidaminobacteraceae bacterium]